MMWPDVKINALYCTNSLLGKIIPKMKILASNGYLLVQQDGAKSHTAKLTIQ